MKKCLILGCSFSAGAYYIDKDLIIPEEPDPLTGSLHRLHRDLVRPRQEESLSDATVGSYDEIGRWPGVGPSPEQRAGVGSTVNGSSDTR